MPLPGLCIKDRASGLLFQPWTVLMGLTVMEDNSLRFYIQFLSNGKLC